LKVVTEEAVRMSDGKLFQAVGLATQNARLQRCRLVRGTTRSPRAADRVLQIEWQLLISFAMHYPIHFMHVHRPYFALVPYNDCWCIWQELGHLLFARQCN